MCVRRMSSHSVCATQSRDLNTISSSSEVLSTLNKHGTARNSLHDTHAHLFMQIPAPAILTPKSDSWNNRKSFKLWAYEFRSFAIQKKQTATTFYLPYDVRHGCLEGRGYLGAPLPDARERSPIGCSLASPRYGQAVVLAQDGVHHPHQTYRSSLAWQCTNVSTASIGETPVSTHSGMVTGTLPHACADSAVQTSSVCLRRKKSHLHCHLMAVVAHILHATSNLDHAVSWPLGTACTSLVQD